MAFSHDPAYSTIPNYDFHPLVYSVQTAFSEHRPLVLTPDSIWITLAQGFAQHINNHAETLSSHFVRYQCRETMNIEIFQFPTQPNQWNDAVQNWALLIRDRVGADLYRLLECNFSTTTQITKTVSQIVMMDAFKKYFNYMMVMICGIPVITLEGTVEDWENIRDRVQSMTQYGLEWWTTRVLPICEEFVQTASGKPSLEFWQAIHQDNDLPCNDDITGWITDLFPYLKHPITDIPSIQNPILKIERAKLTVNDGISPRSFPLGLSEVPITIQTPNNQKHQLALIAGFIGVSQNEDSSLQPEIGWAVLGKSDRFAELLDRIQQEHIIEQPINWDEVLLSFDGRIEKEHFQLLNRFDGATLYANSGHFWKISNFSENRIYKLDCLNNSSAVHLIELEDGRCIVYRWGWSESDLINRPWIVLGEPIKLAKSKGCEWFTLKNSVIIAKDITQLFKRIFQSKGLYFFDDLEFVPILIDNPLK